MLTPQENFQNEYRPFRKGFDEFNDLLTEIAHVQEFSDCIRIAVDHFDEMRTDGDKQSFIHINKMISLLHVNELLLKHLEELANNTFDTLYRK